MSNRIENHSTRLNSRVGESQETTTPILHGYKMLTRPQREKKNAFSPVSSRPGDNDNTHTRRKIGKKKKNMKKRWQKTTSRVDIQMFVPHKFVLSLSLSLFLLLLFGRDFFFFFSFLKLTLTAARHFPWHFAEIQFSQSWTDAIVTTSSRFLVFLDLSPKSPRRCYPRLDHFCGFRWQTRSWGTQRKRGEDLNNCFCLFVFFFWYENWIFLVLFGLFGPNEKKGRDDETGTEVKPPWIKPHCGLIRRGTHRW